MQASSNEPLFFDDLAPWNENSNSIWLASTLILHRNIDNYNFPSKLTLDRRKQIVSLISKEVPNFVGMDKPKLLKSEDCSPLEKEFLIEHCLTNGGFSQVQAGEAFIFDRHGATIITVNIEDHLHFRYIDTKGEIEKAWALISSLETQVGKSVSYSFSQKFGFLTSNPFTCGTGLTAAVFLQLSGLIHLGKWASVWEKLKEESVTTGGLLGVPEEFIGDLVVFRNQFTLGVREEAILATMRNISSKLILEEENAREEIKGRESAEIKDKVARAYGLLIHSYQIETIEALNEIALMKLGVEMGWIDGITLTALNELFFSCRRAHLLRKEAQKIPQEEVAHKRAEFIHRAFKNVILKI